MTSTRSFGEGSTGTQACGMRTRRCSQRRPVPVLGDTGSRRSESRTSTRSTEGTPRRAGTKPALLDHPRAARRRRSFGHTAADQHALLEPRPRSLSHRRRASSLPPRRRARARSDCRCGRSGTLQSRCVDSIHPRMDVFDHPPVHRARGTPDSQNQTGARCPVAGRSFQGAPRAHDLQRPERQRGRSGPHAADPATAYGYRRSMQAWNEIPTSGIGRHLPEVRCLSAKSARRSLTCRFASPTPSAPAVSHCLSGLIPPTPCGCISSHFRP